jgi:hypothetical protein
VRALLWVFEHFLVLLHWNTTENDSASDLFEILGESIKFFFDLESKFSNVTKNKSRAWFWIILINFLKDRNDENSCFTHSRDSLA